ncbi:golgi phospho 3 [Tubulinosema ratisbonensis]|uniref:Golgi phospho 3 n=1 Tax=Tubulinosema ratisbonensis TaxID=291195 RepID=A0A437APV3_9MICR|nr:golgi phospho 3 [Tubulinosema ratisbonensis]
MDELSITRKRNLETKNESKPRELTLSEELVLLIGSRKYFNLICDPISLSLRCLILTELILNDFISLDSNNNVYVTKSSTDNPLLIKALSFLSKESLPLKKWLEILNGENLNTKYKFQLKNTRKIIYKRLEEKKKIKFGNNLHNKSVEVIDYKLRNELISDITNYLLSKEIDLYYDSLVCALFYCKYINTLFISLSPQQQSACRFRVEDILNRYRKYYKRENVKEEMIALLLRSFLKKF